VGPDTDPHSRLGAVDAALGLWRQGDCVVGEYWFVLRFLAANPISPEAQAFASGEDEVVAQEVRGFVVLTQTCDIVRRCKSRPFVEICPLVEVDQQALDEIRGGRRPQYALVPALTTQRLVADLDRTMTVEKPVVAGWSQIVGCNSDAERSAFARALARKRARFAFPDDFNELVSDLQSRIKKKYNKTTAEGLGLRDLSEIRVQATPTWNADSVALLFWFIHHPSQPTLEGRDWSDVCAEWLKLVKPSGRFSTIRGVATTLDNISAFAYLASSQLDLDYLSEPVDAK
jgi:hypothetical protein